MSSIQIDELIRSKRKSVTLIITKEAKLVVRAPLRYPLREIEKLVEEKRRWIESKQREAINKLQCSDKLAFEVGGELLFLGQSYRIEMQEDLKRVVVQDGKIVFPLMPENMFLTYLSKWYRAQAKYHLIKRIEEISQSVSIPYAKASLTSARRRWGSCSASNVIHLTWRLMMAHPKAIDYVITHELCHVLNKNHSKVFWNQVQQLMPDYKLQRKWLKEHAYILDIL
ncbi:MAG: M48 family metallopeptidase [Clostridia bacterium]|nr:M48 family metallopeptidase [Clostridia bacterium]